MTSSISNALNAYQQALTRIGAKIPAEETVPAASGQSEFQEMVSTAMTNAVDLGKKPKLFHFKVLQAKPIFKMSFLRFLMPRWLWKQLLP